KALSPTKAAVSVKRTEPECAKTARRVHLRHGSSAVVFPRTGRTLPHFPTRVRQAVFHDMSKTKTFGIELLVSLVCLRAASQADDAQAQFDSAQYTNGALHLHITNAHGSRYVIQTSSNLADWTALATNSVSQTTFVETKAANFSSRFYRLSSLAGVGSIQTVWIVMMENTDWSTFPNNSDAPYINSLLPRFAHAKNYRSFNHPSLPNYITLEAGDDLGLNDGSCLPGSAHSQSTTDHLTTYLKNKGISWKVLLRESSRRRNHPPSLRRTRLLARPQSVRLFLRRHRQRAGHEQLLRHRAPAPARNGICARPDQQQRGQLQFHRAQRL